jgi:hypothetical protein
MTNMKQVKYEKPEYRAWVELMRRCRSSDPKRSKYYRSVVVCRRWSGLNGSTNFLKDMGPKPTSKHSIDRINNKKGYSPSNCRWATRTEQSNNRRNNIIINVYGEKIILEELSRLLRISPQTLSNRVKSNWPIEQLMSQPYNR